MNARRRAHLNIKWRGKGLDRSPSVETTPSNDTSHAAVADSVSVAFAMQSSDHFESSVKSFLSKAQVEVLTVLQSKLFLWAQP